MIEASKTAELSSQPTKRGRKAWLIALAVVVAVVTIVLLVTPPKPEPVKVWFVRATNEGGVKRLVFEGTNGLQGRILVAASVVTGAKRQASDRAIWAATLSTGGTFAPAQTSFNFTLQAPPKDVAYHVLWSSYGSGPPSTPWERFRMGCNGFLTGIGMPRLANRFVPLPVIHYIPSTEIKE